MSRNYGYLVAGIVLGISMSSIAASGGHRSAVDPGPVTPFTQKDPRYQSAMEHLARATQLLDEVNYQIEKSRQSWQIPGFRYDLLESDVSQIQGRLAPILFVQKKQHEYQQIIPSGDYLTPRKDPADYPKPHSSDQE